MIAEGLISFMEYARDQRFLRVGILAWIVWDWAINLADEVTYLWSGRGPWIKVLYVFIRYAPILHESISFLRFLDMQHSVAVCRAWMLYDLIFIELLIVNVELILVVRVFVLYRINHNILRWVVCGVFISETLMMTILIVITMPMQKYSPQCSSSDSPLEIVGYWLASLLFEMFLWGLTLVKFLQSGCQHLPGFKRRSVMYIMMRDGTWAFALIFLSMIVCLVNVLTSQLSFTPRAGTGYRILLGVLSFSGSHVILNIRRLSTPQDQELLEMSFVAVPLQSIHTSPNGHPEVGRSEDV